MAITGSIQNVRGKYHTVINIPNSKPKWQTTGLPVRGNKRKAEEILRERINEIEKSLFMCDNITVADYLKEWIKTIKNEVKPNTYRGYTLNMNKHIIPYFEQNKMLLKDLKPRHLEEYYKSKLGNISTTTIKHHHQNISKALNDAVRKELIEYNPCTASKVPKAEKYKAEYLEPKEVEELLQLVKGSIIEIPVLLCAVYGLRRSEVLGLKWHCVDLDKRIITISETLQQNTGGEYTDTTKTESSYRTLPILESVYTVLLNHKEHQNSMRALMGKSYINNDYVCTWNNGKVINPNYLTRSFHKIIIKSNLPQIRLHDLRHSVASNLIANGTPITDVSSWLGHSSANTTLNIYAHATKNSKKNIAESIEKMLNVT